MKRAMTQAMAQNGEILRFDAERGFGFIAASDERRNIFFHIRDFRGGTPVPGMAVRFERVEMGRKGPRAVQVQALGAAAGRTAERVARAPRTSRETPRRLAASAPFGLGRQRVLFGLAVLAWLGLLAAISLRRGWPLDGPGVALGLLLVNGLTFAVYAADKSAARQQRRRVPENTLHALALAGGWPAAWLAQQVLRHKSGKTAFLAVYALTTLLHLGALAAWLWRSA